MRLKDYAERDGKRVWLSERELQLLIPDHVDEAGTDAAHAKALERRAALVLMGRCGLRRREAAGVTPSDIVRTDTGRVLRVWEGKGEKYREVPAPEALTDVAYSLGVEHGRGGEEDIIGVTDSTLWDWVEREAQRCYAETGDEGWQFVGPHDLRRSWGVRLLESGVLPSVVMEWGGWEDWETFRNHYLAEFSPEALRRERGKVSWLGGEETGESYAILGTSTPGVASSSRRG
jgi:integrase